jgi:hypothetical protein
MADALREIRGYYTPRTLQISRSGAGAANPLF